MRSRFRLIVLGLLVLVVGIAGVYVWQQQAAARAAAAAAAIRQEVVRRGTIVGTVSATGHLAPQQEVNLFFTATAPQAVAEVNVVLGQTVAAGEVLARLDDRALQLAITEAEQALRAAELSLAELEAPPRPEDLAVAEANVRVAHNQVSAAAQGSTPSEVEIARLNLVMAQNALNQTYATMERLVEQDRWAEKNALQAQADRQVEEAQIADLRYHAAQAAAAFGPVAAAQASLEQAEVALERLQQGPSETDRRIAELQISQAQAALEIVRHDLRGSEIVAPFDGVVAAVNLNEGESAPPAQPAIVLTDVSRFFLDVSVDEVDVASLAPGQPVTITLDALPNATFSGIVEKIAPVASVNAGLVSYAVRVSLAGGDPALRGGMTATVAIVVAEAHNVLLVPNWAIRRDRDTGQAFVGLLRNGTIEDVPVELGLRDETFSEIKTGVNEGDIVAVDTSASPFQLFGGGED